MPHAVRTTINHALDPALGGVDTYTLGTADYYKRKFSPVSVEVQDIRGSEHEYTLDKQGFQLVKHRSSEKDFTEPQKIKKVYYPELEELLKRITGATRAQCFSHIVRRYTEQAVKKDIEVNNIADAELYGEKVPPAAFAHIDQGPESAVQVLDMTQGEEATKLKQSRWAIINAWRPICPVKRDPLGVCDSRSVAESDLVDVYSVPKAAQPGVAKKFVGDKYQVLHLRENSAHRWHFASEMTPDEVLLITIYDEQRDAETGARRRVPHSALPLTESHDTPARESIETRVLLFWEDQSAK